ncbi:MAG: hypothetical protein ACRDMX_09380 [Solirubrobacteraceae bacterium]
MHTSTELRDDSFSIEFDGDRPASIGELLPGFDATRDRIGVVVREPCGAVGASGVLLAAVTAFYDAQRARVEEFYVYPDYFLFHVGRALGDHSMLDVWPSHKEVVVPDDAEAILEAVNDRAITWLLVPDAKPEPEPEPEPVPAPAPAPAQLSAEALASARARITGGFAYSPSGRVADADVRIAGNDMTESYVRAVLDPQALLETLRDTTDPYAASIARRAREVTGDERARLVADRESLRERGRAVETYSRLTPDQTLVLLASWGPAGAA